MAETVGYMKLGYLALLLILSQTIKVDFITNILSKLFLKKRKDSIKIEGINFCSKQEIGDYSKLKEQINDSDSKVKQEHINAIISNLLLNRKRFSKTSTIGFSVFMFAIKFCGCCLKLNETLFRKQKIFINAQQRFNRQLDIVHILKTIRTAELYFKTALTQPQRFLLNVQRRNMVSSQSETSDRSGYD